MDARQTENLIAEIMPSKELGRITQILSNMSHRDLWLFTTILNDLNQHELLDKGVMLLLLISLTFKLPKVEVINVTKAGDGFWKTLLKELCFYRKSATPASYLLGDKVLYRVDKHHPAYEAFSGGHSSVKKGLLVQGAQTRFFAVKKIKHNSLLPNVDRLAMHEVKYAQHLGRTGFVFERKRRFRVVLDWMDGIPLSDVDTEVIKAAPIETLLKCLRHLFGQVLNLHGIYRLVGDMKPDNCILNLATQQLWIIDLEGAHKVGSKKDYPRTPVYADLQEGSLHFFASDVYLLGHVVCRLFPWVDSVNEFTGAANDRMRLIGIACLVDAMFDANPKKRCTVYHADQLCELLLKPVDVLDSELLEYYLGETINCQKMRVEDVMGLTSRPMFI